MSVLAARPEPTGPSERPGMPTAWPTVASLGSILGVWAHPDDEAFLTAGLMAVARRVGSAVAVRTATAGERGTPDPLRWPPARLGDRRRRELATSLDRLGVVDHRVGGLADGRCAALPARLGERIVARWIDEVRPDTIVTFGPDGMTGHPDHRAISAWTTAAWRAGGRSSRLLYATVTPEFHERWGSVNEQVGLWGSGPGPCTGLADLALEIRCDGPLLERKVAALEAHASQLAPLRAALGDEVLRQWWATESFVDADRILGLPTDPPTRAPMAAV